MDEVSYVLKKDSVAYVPVRFFLHCRSFSLCWPLAFLIWISNRRYDWNFHVVLVTEYISFDFYLSL